MSITAYLHQIRTIIHTILARKVTNVITFDILDTENTKQDKLIAHKEKCRCMKIGDIWQGVLGNYHGFQDLGQGHSTGLDIISHSRKIIIELKTRTNTDNASSRLSNLNKLARFKQAHPEYMCVYGLINDKTEQQTHDGSIKIIQHSINIDLITYQVEIHQYVGKELLGLILGENTDEVIECMKNTIDQYTA